MPILTEIGQVEAIREDGVGIVFTPSFLAMAEIGSPAEIVATYADLYNERRAIEAARIVLRACADDGDVDAMVGYFDIDTGKDVPGSIPANEQIVLARHLMKHGVSGGNSKPGNKDEGEYSPTFDPSAYVDQAIVTFQVTPEFAWGLTMTRLMRMFDQKFPKKQGPAADITEEDYDKMYAEYVAQREAKKNGATSR